MQSAASPFRHISGRSVLKPAVITTHCIPRKHSFIWRMPSQPPVCCHDNNYHYFILTAKSRIVGGWGGVEWGGEGMGFWRGCLGGILWDTYGARAGRPRLSWRPAGARAARAPAACGGAPAPAPAAGWPSPAAPAPAADAAPPSGAPAPPAPPARPCSRQSSLRGGGETGRCLFTHSQTPQAVMPDCAGKKATWTLQTSPKHKTKQKCERDRSPVKVTFG